MPLILDPVRDYEQDSVAFYVPAGVDAQPVMVYVEGYRETEALVVAPAGALVAWVPLEDVRVVRTRVSVVQRLG